MRSNGFPVLILLLLIVLWFPGCDDDPASPEPEPEPDTTWADVRIYHDFERVIDVRDGAYVDAGYLFTGEWDDTSGTGFVTLLDDSARQQWLVETSHSGDMVVRDETGYAWVAGNNGQGAVWFARYDMTGDRSLLTTLDNLELRAIRATPDGGCILGAEKDEAIQLLKFSGTGQQEWHREFGGDNPHQLQDIAVLDTSYVLAGQGDVGGFAITWMLIRLNLDGDEIRRVAFSMEDEVRHVAPMPDGGVISQGNQSGTESRPKFILTGPMDEFIWERELSTSVTLRELLVLDDGQIVSGGHHREAQAYTPRVVSFTDPSQVEIWIFDLQHRDYFEEQDTDVFFSCVGVDDLGQLVAAGYTDVEDDGDTDIYLNTLVE